MIIQLSIIQFIFLSMVFCLLFTILIIQTIRFYKFTKWFNNTQCGRVYKKARVNKNSVIWLNGRCYEGVKDAEDALKEGYHG